MKFRESVKKPFYLDPPQKIIIDIQGGLQDILAVYCANRVIEKQNLNSEIIGITCVAGRHTIEQAVKSGLAANYLMNKKIPIYIGQKESLLLNTIYPDTYIQNNFQKLEHELYQLSGHLCEDCVKKDKKAVDFIIESADQLKERLGIVAFGPLTNIGLAQNLEGCLNQIKLVSMNGGQYTGIGTTKQGNVQPNFAYDPLAVHILIQSKGLADKIYINPVEKTLKHDWKTTFIKCYNSCDLREDRKALLKILIQDENKFMLWGPFLTVLPVIMPKLVKNCHYVYAQIVRDSEKVDGLLAINWLKVAAQEGEYVDKLFIYEDFDRKSIEALLLKVLNL